jgi:hypothetical protein
MRAPSSSVDLFGMVEMLRNLHIWIGSYLRQRLAAGGMRLSASPRHVVFCIADHFEPRWGGVDRETGVARVVRWIERYEGEAHAFRDSDGRHPRHSYFFPLEQYDAEYFDLLRRHCRKGFGEVEFHLHHENDTADNLQRTLERNRELFAGDGFLGRDGDGTARYGFVHGNWALDNSAPDGSWCGVNNELGVLHDTGCYADFTLPSAPSPTQTVTINSIYYAVDDPSRPKSHDRGIAVEAGGRPPGRGKYLMIVQGALGLDWKWRRWGLVPRIENSDISAGHLPMRHRCALWLRANVTVKGRPEWAFIKVHTHGCTDENFSMFFEHGGFARLHGALLDTCPDGGRCALHYVTAREMYNIVKAAEAGETGNPSHYRDYEITPPPL